MADRDLRSLPEWARELLEQSRIARLGLLDDRDRPRVLPVTFAVAEERIWTAVDEKPKRVPPGELARVRFLRRNPHAALTVDRYSDDWEQLAWVQVLGRVEVLTADEAGGGVSSLVAKYEPYRGSPPAGPILRLDPERCLCWRASD